MAAYNLAFARTPAFVNPSSLQNNNNRPPALTHSGLSQATPIALSGTNNRLGTLMSADPQRQSSPLSRLGTSRWVGEARQNTQLNAFNNPLSALGEGEAPEGVSPKKDAFEVGYQPLSGTSMATPHVAAVVADILSINPKLKTDEVRCILINSAISGRMNHLQALMQAEQSLTQPIDCPVKPLPNPKSNEFIPEKQFKPLTQNFESPVAARMAASGYAAAHNVVAAVDDNELAVIPKQVMVRVSDDIAKGSFDQISDFLNHGLDECEGDNCRPHLRVTGQISPTTFIASVEREAVPENQPGQVTPNAGELQASAMKMVCNTLPHYPGVKAIEADVIFPVRSDITEAGGMVKVQEEDQAPGDPLRPKQWGLDGPEQFGIGTDAAKAFQKMKGFPTPREAGIHIGVGDTGAGVHPDMEEIFLPGRRFDRSNYPADDAIDRTLSVSHGVHVAGTAGAITGNNIGIEGVTDAKILPAKVLSDQGSGSLVDIILGIRWMAGLDIDGHTHTDTPARVINLSLGYEDACSQFLQDTINEANEKGVVVVVAAGNSNIDAGRDCPSNCRNVITVGAHDPAGKRAEFSNFGPIVDVYAPGVNILAPTHRKVQAKSPEDTPKGPGPLPKPPESPNEGADPSAPSKKPWWLRLG